jgi:hypothetical protein
MAEPGRSSGGGRDEVYAIEPGLHELRFECLRALRSQW